MRVRFGMPLSDQRRVHFRVNFRSNSKIRSFIRVRIRSKVGKTLPGKRYRENEFKRDLPIGKRLAYEKGEHEARATKTYLFCTTRRVKLGRRGQISRFRQVVSPATKKTKESQLLASSSTAP